MKANSTLPATGSVSGAAVPAAKVPGPSRLRDASRDGQWTGGSRDGRPTSCLADGPTIDLQQREIRHAAGLRHKLSRLESALLTCLIGHAGRPVTRGELLLGVWQMDPLRTVTRTVDMHISMLRKKLGDDSRQPALLVTVYGVGYMMRPMTLTA